MPLPTNGDPPEGAMNRVEGESFSNTTVVLDYTHYKDCSFHDCTMIFHGHGGTGLVDCKFDNCQWRFGSAAGRTLEFMATMYSHGGGAQNIIDQTFENIRRGSL